MNHLTIEHLAGYLPWGLKLLHVGEIHYEGVVFTLKGLKRLKRYDRVVLFFNDEFYFGHLNEVKPLLHPLERLTDGYIRKLRDEYEDYFNIPHDSNALWNEYKNMLKSLSEDIPLTLKLVLVERLPNYLMKKLYKDHFDLHGLILQGLAIPIEQKD